MAARLIMETDVIEVSRPPVLLYGQPGCLSGNTFIAYQIRDTEGKLQNSKGGSMELLFKRFNNVAREGKGFYQRPQTVGSQYFVQSVTDEGRVFLNKIEAVVDSGVRIVHKVTTESGRTIKATLSHEFLTDDGYIQLGALKPGDAVFVNPGRPKSKGGRQKRPYRAEVFVKHHAGGKMKVVNGCTYFRVRASHAAYEAKRNGMTYDEYIHRLNILTEEQASEFWCVPADMEIHHRDENINNNDPENLVMVDASAHQRLFHLDRAKETISVYVENDRIVSIENVGDEHVYDIVCTDPYRNFVADGIVVHNSGKTSLAQTADKPLTLDFDGGAHRSGFRKTVMRFDSWDDVVEAQRDKVLDPYETIVIDTVGTLLEYMSQSIIAGNAKLGTRAGGLSMQGWGVLKGTFNTWLSALKQAGKQVILIAHQKEDKDGDSKILRPDIAGGSYSIIMNSSDVVGYISYRNNHRHIAWEPTDQYFAKNGAQLKSGPIPDFSSSPHFAAELLTQAKANLGRNAEASAAAAKIVDEWKSRLATDHDLATFNSWMALLAPLAPGVKAQAWKLVTEHADSKGWEILKGAKAFTVKPAAGKPATTLGKLQEEVQRQFERVGNSAGVIKQMLGKYKAETFADLNDGACKLLIAELTKIPDREPGCDEPEEAGAAA